MGRGVVILFSVRTPKQMRCVLLVGGWEGEETKPAGLLVPWGGNCYPPAVPPASLWL